ncbi:Type II secretion system protein F [bacterium HR19]|nr:Type II secretion system protein F [bacterium HR19]
MSDSKYLKILKELYSFLSAHFSIDFAVRKIGGDIEKHIQRGLPLSASLKAEGFPQILVQNIKIGEETGKLKEVLGELVKLLEDKIKLEREIVFSLFYPALSISAFLIFFLAVGFFVIPEISRMLSELGVEVPKSIIVIESIKNFLKGRYEIFAIFGVIVFYLSYEFRKGGIPIVKNAKFSLFLKALAICIENKIELQRALLMTSDLAPENIKEKIEEEASRIIRGLEPTFEFLGEFQSEIENAYKTGELSSALRGLSQIFYEKYMKNSEILKKSIEPLFLIVVAILTIFIVSAIYIPMIEKIRDIM